MFRLISIGFGNRTQSNSPKSVANRTKSNVQQSNPYSTEHNGALEVELPSVRLTKPGIQNRFQRVCKLGAGLKHDNMTTQARSNV